MEPERQSVLVVEDDDATRAFLVDNLAADGFKAVGASGAGEGLRAIEVRRPVLLVLDLMLGDASGLELLDRIRSSDGLASRIDPDLPVVILTGRTGESDRVRGFARGADDYVLNPNPKWVAPPGTSLHRYGTELDLGPLAAYGWLAENARRFGFIQRYRWEAWHYKNA